MRIARQLKRHWGSFVIIACAAVALGYQVDNGDEVQFVYRTGAFHADRGDVIALPAGTRETVAAHYGGSGRCIMICATGGGSVGMAAEAPVRGGWWTWDRTTGKYHLIHDNASGELKWGASLSQLEHVRISPDGRTVAALRTRYSPDAKSIVPSHPDSADQLDACLERYEWILVDVGNSRTTVLRDLSDEKRNKVWSPAPHRFVWLDDKRLAFTRATDQADAWSCVYSLSIPTGQVTEAVREEPGAEVGHLRQVSQGKILYCTMSAAGVAAGRDYLESMPVEEWDRNREEALSNEGVSLKLADLTGEEAVVRTLAVAAAGFDLRNGVLSPSEKFYAFTRFHRDEQRLSLAILNLENSRLEVLDRVAVDLLQWHPDGTKLLGMMNPKYPQDPAGVLVEIPVGDVLAALEVGPPDGQRRHR